MRLTLRQLLIGLVMCGTGGCGAQRVLYKPTAAERSLLAQPPLNLSVVVRHWTVNRGGLNPSAYANNAAALVTGSNAFRRADLDPAGATRADLTAESTGDYCNSAIIPLPTILTLGLFPTVWKETQCDGVVFRKYGAPLGTDSVVVRIAHSGTSLMGWVAAPIGLLPGWAWKTGRSQSGYRKSFRLGVIAHRAELERLARHLTE